MSASARRRSSAAGAWGGSACRGKPTGRQRPALAELRIVVSVARDGRWQVSTPLAGSAGALALRTRSTGHGRATGRWRTRSTGRGQRSTPAGRAQRGLSPACSYPATPLRAARARADAEGDLLRSASMSASARRRSNAAGAWGGSACRGKPTGRQRPALAELRIVVSVARDGRWQVSTPLAGSAGALALRTRSTGHGRATGRWRTRSTGRGQRSTPAGRAQRGLSPACSYPATPLRAARARADAAPPPSHPLDSLVFVQHIPA